MDNKTHFLTHCGDEYYYKTGTLMGVMYDGGNKRWDWGNVAEALKLGDSIFIYPMRDEEKPRFDRMMEKINKEREENVRIQD